MQPNPKGYLDRGPGHFAVALSGMTVADVKKRASDTNRKIQSEARPCLRGVHVAAKLGRNDRAARLAARRGDADAPQKWLHRDLHRETGIERVKGRLDIGAKARERRRVC